MTEAETLVFPQSQPYTGLISYRWKIGWALDELVSPILALAVFMVAWYVLN